MLYLTTLAALWGGALVWRNSYLRKKISGEHSAPGGVDADGVSDNSDRRVAITTNNRIIIFLLIAIGLVVMYKIT